MKMNDLKKFGAVALAAVMAVTFAPVASLNVFATDVTTVGNEITGGGDLSKAGSYKIADAAVNSTVAIEVKATKENQTYTIDLNGAQGVTISAKDTNCATGTTINIVGGTLEKTDGTLYYAKLNLSNCETHSAINLSGELQLGATYKPATSGASISVGSEPVAKLGTNHFMGDGCINENVKNNDVEAENGAVSINYLMKGHTAKIAATADRDTTLKATTKDKVTLTSITTTYTYYYDKDSAVADSRDGVSQYTKTEYIAGAAKTKTDLEALTTPTITDLANKLDTDHQKSVYSVPQYERAITVNKNNEDWGTTKVATVGVDSAAGVAVDMTAKNLVNGITYLTADPKDIVADKTGVAVVDGDKYVLSTSTKNNLAKVTYTNARSSVEVVRGINYKDNNKKAYGSFDVKAGVKVTAASDLSVLTATQTYVNGSAKYNVQSVVFEGADESVDNYISNKLPKSNPSGSVISNTINAVQVVDGDIVPVEAVGSLVTVTRADGIGYFKGSGENYDGAALYVFGGKKAITPAFEAYVAPSKVYNLTIDPLTKGNNVYASKEISTTVKGVKKAVIITGEISSELTATAEDGTNTWEVNLGYDSETVPAYRMYRKSGEHVYTINPAEVSMLEAAGWTNEGTAFYVNPVTSKKGTPVYRVYNRNNGGMHFYTANAAEKDMLLQNGWTEGAVVFYGAEKATGIPVYRTYNTGSNNGEHNYTTNIAESDMNVKAGWRAEGVAFYVFK